MKLFAKNHQRRHQFINRELKQTFSINASEIIGKTVFNLFPADNAAARALQGENVRQAGIFSSMVIDGCVRWMAARKLPVHGADRTMIALGRTQLQITGEHALNDEPEN